MNIQVKFHRRTMKNILFRLCVSFTRFMMTFLRMHYMLSPSVCLAVMPAFCKTADWIERVDFWDTGYLRLYPTWYCEGIRVSSK